MGRVGSSLRASGISLVFSPTASSAQTRFSLMGEAGEQMRRVSFSRPGSSHRFAKDFERIGGRGLTRGPDPCREELFKALDINLRQQPAIEGTAWRQKQAGAQDLAQQNLVLKAPPAQRLGAVTGTEQPGDPASPPKSA